MFSNISAEKALEHEKTLMEYTKVMFASISHDLRTPCNAALNGLFLMKARVRPEDKKNFMIVESSL